MTDGVQKIGNGIFKRRQKRKLGLLIDGVGLDRATRRLERKIDLTKFVTSVCEGLKPEIARYYTLVPHEDDARQLAFLDAVEKAGLEVMLKRLPPKGVKRQVSMDIHMAVDAMAFANGRSNEIIQRRTPLTTQLSPDIEGETYSRHLIIVCPNRELSYSIHVATQLGVKTTLADFGQYGSSDSWQGIDRWVDLSTSETIWRD